MKVRIEGTQEEFDAKRPQLLKTLAGTAIDCVMKAKSPSVYGLEKPAIQPRRAALRAQNQIMDAWDAGYRAMIEAIKGDVDAVLRDAAG